MEPEILYSKTDMNKQRLQIGIASLIFGLIGCASAYLSDNEFLRAALTLPYVFLLWPYALSICFYPKPLLLVERFLLGSGLGILAQYPLGILLTMIEGKSGEAIYSSHLPEAIFLLLSTNIIFILLAALRKAFKENDKFEKPDYLKGGILILGLFLLFLNLNRADLNTDEADIGYIAYDLVDGMLAGRNAFFVSTNSHTPLALISNHFGMQLINDGGFHVISDWALRAVNAFMAFLSLLGFGVLIQKTPKKFQYAALALTLSSSAFLLNGRVLLREVFVMFFLILSLLFLHKFNESKSRTDILLCAIFSSGILLSKSVLFFLPLLLLFGILLSSKEFSRIKSFFAFSLTNIVLFSPIIIYNIAAYLKTGYMDILFSKIFGIYNPFGYTGDRAYEAAFSSNIILIIKNFADQYSFMALVFLALGVIISVFKLIGKKLPKEESFLLLLIAASVLFFAFTGLRAYYMIFLSPFFIYFVAKGIFFLPYKMLHGVFFTLLAANLFLVSFNTHISNAYTVDSKWQDSGRSGMEVPPLELFRAYSYTIRPWVENYAWKELKEYKDEHFTKDTVVLLDKALNPLDVRKYLNVNQDVKAFYLGENLEEDFIVAEEAQPYDYAIHLYQEGLDGYEIKKSNDEILYIISQ